MAAANLNLSAIDEGVGVVSIAGKDRVVEFGRFVQAVFQDEQLNVILLNLQVFRMVVINRAIFGGGFVEVAGGEIEVAQHAVASGVVGESGLYLLEECLGLSFLSLRDVEAGERGGRVRIF